jgi:hypothetical protein
MGHGTPFSDDLDRRACSGVTIPMQDSANNDADFILSHAERLVKVATMCVISFGLADGLNEALKASPNEINDWRQAAAGFQDGTLMMAALRAALLLDRDDAKVSFQTIHRRLKSGAVQDDLKQSLAQRHGFDDVFPPSRDELIAAFFEAYSEIDWEVHGRLKHFRNLGIAHLTVEKMTKSITLDELRKFVSIISRLTATIQQLCHTPTAFREWMLEEYREIARKAMMKNPPA